MGIRFDQTALARFLKEEEPRLFGKLCELRTAVEGWLAYVPQSFPHYTRHTVLHSDAILVQISKLLFVNGEDRKPVLNISPMEAYIAAAAAYLHDSGMVMSDAGKIEILQSEEWRTWIETGAAAKRWAAIQTFRSAELPQDESLRSFLADVQTRFLVAEFVRRTHHLRARDVLSEYEDEFGRFAFNDPVLLRTIGDVCISHGLEQRELEDRDRYPERRDIDGHQVNVRFVAILLRLGDLLEMSHDRACPLLLSAACPLPPESLAHWTQYQCVTHTMTAPDRIEITAECRTQQEHRFIADWCAWLTEELRNAEILLARSTRHGGWHPPVATMEGSDATIQIRPAKGATYVPSKWRFMFDEDAVFRRLIEDVYESPDLFIRELIQNAADATRCQLYLDLSDRGLLPPQSPTLVDEAVRQRYRICVAIEGSQILNEMSGEYEMRDTVIVEDSGVGMDRDIIERFFLQVGRSFYATKEFQRQFSFSPSSRFGVGFLSTFAVSDHVTVETFKPSSRHADGPLRIVLTGPRNYLLTEKGRRRSSGTRIEVRLREQLSRGSLLDAVKSWCKRVEFPIEVNERGIECTVRAERSADFIQEMPDKARPGEKFLIRGFDIQRNGLEGELYVFAHIDEKGESWADLSWAKDEYLRSSPQAAIPEMPGDQRFINGIAVRWFHAFPDEWCRGGSERVDYRDGSLIPNLSRSSAALTSAPVGRTRESSRVGRRS